MKLFVLVFVVSLYGCGNDCRETPHLQECAGQLPAPADGGATIVVFPDAGPNGDLPDAQVVEAELTYTNLEQVKGECGETRTNVAWTITGDGAPDDGWIVQRIFSSTTSRRFITSSDSCDMGLIIPEDVYFYEAWKVVEGEKIPESYHGIDQWYHPANAYGNNPSLQSIPGLDESEYNFIYVKGEAVFLADELPDTFVENSIAQAASWATYVRPVFWDNTPDEEKLVRKQLFAYQCCDQNVTSNKDTFVCLDTHFGINNLGAPQCKGADDFMNREDLGK